MFAPEGNSRIANRSRSATGTTTGRYRCVFGYRYIIRGSKYPASAARVRVVVKPSHRRGCRPGAALFARSPPATRAATKSSGVDCPIQKPRFASRGRVCQVGHGPRIAALRTHPGVPEYQQGRGNQENQSTGCS